MNAEVTLETIANGALFNQFERELQRVLENIQDPNTKAEAKRGITIKIDFLPNELRENAAILCSVSASIAGPRPQADVIHMGMKDGKLVGVRFDPRQRDIFDGEDRPDDVLPITTMTEKAGSE